MQEGKSPFDVAAFDFSAQMEYQLALTGMNPYPAGTPAYVAVYNAFEHVHAARTALQAAPASKPLMEWDFFLSHYQLNGGPQMGQLHAELKLAGKSAWYDKSEEPSVEGMLKGVANSDTFLLFLTRDVFTRPFCLLEIREALRLRKPFILLLETEPRLTYCAKTTDKDGKDAWETKHTSATVEEHSEAAKAAGLEQLFDKLVALPHRQEMHEREAMIKELCRPGKGVVMPE